MIEIKPHRPFEFRNETKAQDNEITAILKASTQALDKQTVLETLVISLLRDFHDTGNEIPIETRCALREHLNKFSNPDKIKELL